MCGILQGLLENVQNQEVYPALLYDNGRQAVTVSELVFAIIGTGKCLIGPKYGTGCVI